MYLCILIANSKPKPDYRTVAKTRDGIAEERGRDY